MDARDDDVAAELCMLEQRAWNADATLFVELALRGSREEEALHAPAFLAERAQRREAALHHSLPRVPRVREEASVHASGDDDAVPECLPEARRKREAVLVVERVFVLAKKHAGPVLLYHFPPH